MTDELSARLGEPDGWRSVDLELGALLREGPTGDLEDRLRHALLDRTDAVSEAAMRLGPGSVSVTGWEVLDAEITGTASRGHTITAVGLDLSNYGDGGDEWWDKEPLVEVAVYEDSAFPFSTATAEEMLAVSVSYAAPWTGCMLGEEMSPLEVHGLKELNGLLLRRQALEIEGDPVADRLGWWWQTLRFHQAVADAVGSRGLALRVPVLVGEHDAGPWVVSIVVPDRVSDHHESTERLLGERAAANRAWYDAHTEETVAEIVGMREGTRGWGWRNRDKRRSYVAYADARIALVASIVGIPKPDRSVEKMSDAELDDVVNAYRAARNRS